MTDFGFEKRVEKLYKRTGIKEREYKLEGKVASDLGAEAVINSGDNFSLWDCFGIAHDFGDCKFGTPEINWLPSIASQIVFREMQADRLSATPTVAYDVIANKNWYNFAKEVFASNDKKAYIIPQSERDRNRPIAKKKQKDESIESSLVAAGIPITYVKS